MESLMTFGIILAAEQEAAAGNELKAQLLPFVLKM